MELSIGFHHYQIFENISGFPEEFWFIIKIDNMKPFATRRFNIHNSNLEYMLPNIRIDDDELMDDIKVKVTLCCFSHNSKEIIPFGRGKFTIGKFFINQRCPIELTLHNIHCKLQDIIKITSSYQIEEDKKVNFVPIERKPKLCMNAYVY